MRKINLILANAAIAAALLLSSCKKDEDETTADEAKAPTVVLQNNSASTAITANKEVAKGSTVLFNVQVFKGDKNAQTLEVKKNGASINASSTPLDVNGSSEKNNPFNVDNDKFYEFSFTAPSTDGAKDTYEFIVKDRDGLSSSVSVDITTKAASPSLSTKTGNKMYNNGGKQFGSFDFELLTAVSSNNNTTGDIVDAGVPVAAPQQAKQALQAKENWKKQFSAINGAELKKITKTEYEAASTEADISSIGTVVTGAETYAVDNAYVVKTKEGKYVAFVITAVTEDSSGNNDYVTFSTKSAVATKTVVDKFQAAN